MNKSALNKSLTYLKKIFSEDHKAISAVKYLLSQVEQLEESIPKNSSGERFPLPDQLVDQGYHFALYSDGACRGNPGPGAWGMMGQDQTGAIIFQSSSVEMMTTNNRMELAGAIAALKELLDYRGTHFLEEKVVLFSDSKYVVDGITKWVAGWKKRQWKKADKKEPENLELWKDLDRLVSQFSAIDFEWVKGHAGHPQNEYCDHLANIALDQIGK